MNQGALPASDEFEYKGFICQVYRFPGETLQHWFKVVKGEWDKITHWTREN